MTDEKKIKPIPGNIAQTSLRNFINEQADGSAPDLLQDYYDMMKKVLPESRQAQIEAKIDELLEELAKIRKDQLLMIEGLATFRIELYQKLNEICSN